MGLFSHQHRRRANAPKCVQIPRRSHQRAGSASSHAMLSIGSWGGPGWVLATAVLHRPRRRPNAVQVWQDQCPARRASSKWAGRWPPPATGVAEQHSFVRASTPCCFSRSAIPAQKVSTCGRTGCHSEHGISSSIRQMIDAPTLVLVAEHKLHDFFSAFEKVIAEITPAAVAVASVITVSSPKQIASAF